jgi:hypothetical protein
METSNCYKFVAWFHHHFLGFTSIVGHRRYYSGVGKSRVESRQSCVCASAPDYLTRAPARSPPHASSSSDEGDDGLQKKRKVSFAGSLANHLPQFCCIQPQLYRLEVKNCFK